MLYTIEAPTGPVTVIVPEGTVQVGCTVILAVGEAGTDIVLMVNGNDAEIQPDILSFAVME